MVKIKLLFIECVLLNNQTRHMPGDAADLLISSGRIEIDGIARPVSRNLVFIWGVADIPYICLYTCTECGMVLPNVPDDMHPRFCPYCMGKLKSDESSTDWMSEIYSDDNLWYMDGFFSFPSIIAHECWRLRDMFREKQPYGVYFQIRDLAETILKFEVLSVCAWAEASKIQDFQKQVGCLITTRGLSLGAWYEVSRRIQVFSKNMIMLCLPLFQSPWMASSGSTVKEVVLSANIKMHSLS